MSWRTEGNDVHRLEAQVARLTSELEQTGLREHERRLVQAELETVRAELEQAQRGRKLL